MDQHDEVADDPKPSTIIPPPRREKFGRGYVTDDSVGHDRSKDPSIRHHLGASLGAPKEASLAGFVQHVKDQYGSSECTGFAFGMAAHVRLLKLCQDVGGDPTKIPWVSTQAIYTSGRALDLPSTSDTLSDDGAAPSQVVRGMATQGIPADSVWPPGGFEAAYNDPADPEHDFLNAVPDLKELQAASTFVLQGYFRIDEGTTQTVEDVKQALAAGYPVCVGVNVDQAFEDQGGKTPVGPCGPHPLGGHMLCVVGYKTDAKGNVAFRVVNSWGPAWADGGFFWATAAWLMSASDVYAITVTPR